MQDGLVHGNLTIPIKSEELAFSFKVPHGARVMKEQPSKALRLCPAGSLRHYN